MIGIIDWLIQRRTLNMVIVVVYSALILHMHDPMVKVSVKLMNYFTRQVYDVIVGSIATIFLLGIVYYFIKMLLRYRQATEIKVCYLLTVVSLLFLHTQINFVMNIELIHTVEFGILAFLIFPLTRRFGNTAFYALLVGMLDEWYQYNVEKPDSNYFDFNDLVLDLLGIGFVLVLLYSSGLNNKSYPRPVPWYRSPVFYIASLIAISVTVLLQLSLIQVYAGSENAWVVLNRDENTRQFWTHLPNSDIVFHVMQPLEGTTLLIALLSLFFLLDHLARRSIAAENTSAVRSGQTIIPAL